MTEHHPGFLAFGALGAAMDELVRQMFAGFQAWKAQTEARIRAANLARSEAVIEAHRREQQRVEDKARRARLAAFEASDPAGRLEAMNREHRAVASRLAAEYGFDAPHSPAAQRRRFLAGLNDLAGREIRVDLIAMGLTGWTAKQLAAATDRALYEHGQEADI